MQKIIQIAILVVIVISMAVYADSNDIPKTPDSNGIEKVVVQTPVKIESGGKESVSVRSEAERLKIENTIMQHGIKAYEKSVNDLRWALGALVAVALAVPSILVFKNSREYKDALRDAKDAGKEARDSAEGARDWEEKAQGKFREIDKRAKEKLDEIDSAAKERDKKSEDKIKTIVSKKLREFLSETEKQRKISELSFLGVTLLSQTKNKKGNEKENLLKDAKKKFLQAEDIKEGSEAYNLACVAGMRKDKEECKRWLKVGEKAGMLTTIKHAMKDEDLKEYWNEEWFKKIKWKG
ncbi:MAG: hypothetical protein K8R02_00625 [Anaerohalosphaeraceae bacterium]|nr:hypothetical protein [Anaerohalosphaeraceae bacterium]